MKRRMSEIINSKSIGASGEVITADLPTDYSVTALVISIVALDVTDAATLAEVLANMTWLEVTTRSGSPIKISGLDLYHFNREMFKMTPLRTNIASTVDFVYNTLIFPLNPIGVWDTSMGMSPTENGKVRLTMGTDTATGATSRTVTCTAIGIEGIAPWGYLGAFQDSYTSVVGDNFRDIQQEKVLGMMGTFTFQTTGLNALTTTDAQGIQKIGYGISNSIKESIRQDAIVALGAYGNTHEAEVTEAEVNTLYTLWNLGLTEGTFVPYVDKLQVYLKHGVAEATRLYPLLAVRN